MEKVSSVKWYEPFSRGNKVETIQPCIMGLPSVMVLPSGRGWHEQTFTKDDHAAQFAGALRVKGFVLVEIRRFQVVNDGLRIDC